MGTRSHRIAPIFALVFFAAACGASQTALNLPSGTIPAPVPTGSGEDRLPTGPASRTVDQAIAWALGIEPPESERYYYLCLRFVSNAYDYKYGHFYSAKVAADVAAKNCWLKTGAHSHAPRGAWVFWELIPDGHVGMRTDGTKVVHVWPVIHPEKGKISERRHEEFSDIRNLGRFRGWVNPEDIAPLRNGVNNCSPLPTPTPQTDYTYAIVSQSPHPTMSRGGSAQFTLVIRNTGTKTWYRYGTNPVTVNLGTDRPQDRIPGFIREDIVTGNPSGWVTGNRVTMQEAVVPPGGVATFIFWMSAAADKAPGVHREHFRPVADGATWMPEQGIYWDVTVLPIGAEYDYAIVSQSPYPTMSRGGSAQFTLVIRNTGTKTWYRYGTNPITVNLGTDRPQDRIPGFIREDIVTGNPSGWVSGNRVTMQEAVVPPGGVATFIFWMSAAADKTPGVHREYFRPVADGATWMKDLGIYWDVRVLGAPGDYHAQWVSQNAHPTLKRNGCYRFEVLFRNTGAATWHPTVVRLGTDRPQDRIPGFIREDRCTNQASGWTHPNRVELLERAVPPGGIGTFAFWYTVPHDKQFGTGREYFRPVADFITWMEDWGVYWDVTVIP